MKTRAAPNRNGRAFIMVPPKWAIVPHSGREVNPNGAVACSDIRVRRSNLASEVSLIARYRFNARDGGLIEMLDIGEIAARECHR